MYIIKIFQFQESIAVGKECDSSAPGRKFEYREMRKILRKFPKFVKYKRIGKKKGQKPTSKQFLAHG